MTRRMSAVHIIGGGLAGCEAAWQLARRSVPVVLHEMRPVRATAVHRTAQLAELVCSNSFRSDDAQGSAIGLLHAEMRRLQSLIMRAADAHKLPAGSALAVDRDGFAGAVSAALDAEPLVEIRREEIALPPADYVNCPLSRDDYESFVDALLAGEKTAFHEFETTTPYFDGCLAIEVMAER